MRLIACSGCRRHIDVVEATCPFCGIHSTSAASAMRDAAVLARPTTRRGWLLGTALAVAVAGCGGESADESTTHEEPGTGGEPTSGGEATETADLERTGGDEPVADAGAAGGAATGSGDAGAIVVLYGASPSPEE